MKVNIETRELDFDVFRLAGQTAEKFAVGYPDRVGSYRGVAYHYDKIHFYVYRTKNGTIMVREI